MSTEWQEAMNERAIEQKMNPITGGLSAILFAVRMITTAPRYLVGRIQGQGLCHPQIEYHLMHTTRHWTNINLLFFWRIPGVLSFMSYL
jgi:hypothetical protein